MAHIILKRKLELFWKKHPDCKQSLESWYDVAKNANWTSPQDVKASYIKASILKKGRVVFNINRNSYRLVVQIDYRTQSIFIRFIGSHQEYDTIDANTV